MNRRKFLQISAFICAAPVISKIDSIASINADACLSPSVYNWDQVDNISPLEIFREVAEKLIINGHIPGKSHHGGLILDSNGQLREI